MAAAPQITIGDQPTFKVFGLTFDTYVIVATLVAAAIVLLMGCRACAGRATSGVPGKLQLFFEYARRPGPRAHELGRSDDGGEQVRRRSA